MYDRMQIREPWHRSIRPSSAGAVIRRSNSENGALMGSQSARGLRLNK